MRYIDCFNHFFPKGLWDKMLSTPGAVADIGARMRGVPAIYDLDRRRQVCDMFKKKHDYTQVISLGMPPLEALGTPKQVEDFAKLGNDGMAELCAKYPDYFCGWLASLPMNSKNAAKELERAFKNGACAVQIHTNINGDPLDDPKYFPVFEAAAKLEQVAALAQAKFVSIGWKNAETNDLARFQAALESEPKSGPGELWLVLLGHGTFDNKEAKFNLRGPDLSASELAEWLKPFQRPVAIVNCSSASGPFLNKLSAAGRVVVTATRSGNEVNYTRFGGQFAAALGSPEADLDKDGQTSLLEAYLLAASRVAEFYETEGRLATEHPLLDDNGDGLGTPPDWFRGVRAVKKAKDGATVDGLRAHQFVLVRSEQERKLSPAVRAKRDEIELAIGKLRERKSELPEPEYYQKLEPLLLDLARLYQSAK